MIKKYPHSPIQTETIPYTNGRYKIQPTNFGNQWIITQDSDVINPIEKDLYDIAFFDQVRRVSIGFLANLTYRPLIMAEKFYYRFDVYHIDGSESNNGIDNLLWKIPQGGIPTPERSDYNVAPNYTMYGISSDGRYFNRDSGRDLTVRKASKSVLTGYKILDYGTGNTVTLHRAIAMAFISTEIPYTKLHVNHIDSNRENNVLANLEWVTAFENALHASQAHPFFKLARKVVIKDYLLDKILVMDSISQAIRVIGVSYPTIKEHIDKKKESLINMRYLCRYLDDAKTFPKEDDDLSIASKEHYKNRAAIDFDLNDKRVFIAIDMFTNEILRFHSIDIMSRELDIKVFAIIGYFKLGYKYPIKGYMLRIEDSWGGMESERSLTEEELDLFMLNDKPTMYLVRVTKQDDPSVSQLFYSFTEASDMFGRGKFFIKDAHRKYKKLYPNVTPVKFEANDSNNRIWICEIVPYQ